MVLSVSLLLFLCSAVPLVGILTKRVAVLRWLLLLPPEVSQVYKYS